MDQRKTFVSLNTLHGILSFGIASGRELLYPSPKKFSDVEFKFDANTWFDYTQGGESRVNVCTICLAGATMVANLTAIDWAVSYLQDYGGARAAKDPMDYADPVRVRLEVLDLLRCGNVKSAAAKLYYVHPEYSDHRKYDQLRRSASDFEHSHRELVQRVNESCEFNHAAAFEDHLDTMDWLADVLRSAKL